jgi:flagella basal body P-ring formation protein FlgA
MKKALLFFLLLTQCLVASAAQDHAQLRAGVADFVRTQTASMQGKVIFQIDEIDPRIALRNCARVETFLPAGSRLMGKTAVGVRCNEENGWSLLIPVQIKVNLDLVISAHQLSVGITIRAEDVAMQNSESSQNSGISDPKQAIGKVLRYSIAAGQFLRQDMLRDPYTVSLGQAVKLLLKSSGLSIRGDGVALNNASEGRVVQVRTQSGRVISGIAGADGVVEISP